MKGMGIRHRGRCLHALWGVGGCVLSTLPPQWHRSSGSVGQSDPILLKNLSCRGVLSVQQISIIFQDCK